MTDTHRRYEIRCPVHGFISISDWEREIIAQPAFQRLRRIRQLAWTDQIYPGAMHTRFEHSLGVMHIASLLYDAVAVRSLPLLKDHLSYTEEGLRRDKLIVRLTALLHDTGHSPFSHAGEDLFPIDPASGKAFKHEAYSAAIIRHELRDVIENHPLNQNFAIKAEDLASLLEGSATAGRRVFWRELIDGQMDADRMDYLLRDSLHTGVDYGKYDWKRLLNTVQAVELPQPEGEEARQGLRFGVTEGGIHAAEALVLARYYMFTQVYFHKTRVAYDHHIRHALRELLPNGRFPPPTVSDPHGPDAPPSPPGLKDYLRWDDWRVLGALADQKGGDHGLRLSSRNHYREVYHTPECSTPSDLRQLERVRNALGSFLAATESSRTSAYKLADPDITVVTEDDSRIVRPLSHYSPIVQTLNRHPLDMVRLFARPESAKEARATVARLSKEPS